MATYSLVTNGAQETALSTLVARENTRRAAQTPPLPALTNAEYMQQVVFAGVIADYGRQYRRIAAYNALTQQQRDDLGLRDEG
jgi:hypothetical protein